MKASVSVWVTGKINVRVTWKVIVRVSVGAGVIGRVSNQD